jgi:hypothetical protein
MKPIHTILAPVLAVMLATSGWSPADTPRMATGNDRELWLSGDFDGNGREDALVIERATGLMRVGYAQEGGRIFFESPVSCGTGGVTWALAAPLTVASRDQLVVFAPTANRLHLLGLSDPGRVTDSALHASGPGPRTGAALDLPGGVNPPSLDLLVHNEYTTVPATAGHLRGLRNSGGIFTQEGNAIVNHLYDHAAAIVPASGQAAHAGWMRREPGASAFEFRSATISSYTLVDQVAGLPENARFTCGSFDADRLDYFFFTPGQSTGQVNRLDDVAVPGQWRFGASVPLDFSGAVEMLTVVRGADGASELLVAYQDGTAARAAYSGAKGLGILHPVAAGPGRFATGVVARGSGEFVMFTAAGPGESSDGWRQYGLDAGTLTLLDEGILPALANTSGGANVLLFGAHPFRDTNAPLLGSYHIYDWTTRVDLESSPGKVFASGLRYISPVTGLGGEETSTLAEAPVGTMAALFNQYHPQISIVRTDGPTGELPVDVEAIPGPGHFSEAVSVSLAASPSGASIFFRTADGPFAAYSSPIHLTRDTTIAFHSVHNGLASPLRVARYTFAAEPDDLDADGDGVPDFVESAVGLDPSGGSDHDEDGFSDLEELLADTNPANPAEKPAGHPDLGDTLTLRVTPRPYDFILSAGSTAATGTEVRARSVTGNLLGMRATGHNFTQAYRAEVLCTPITPGLRWMMVSTPFHHAMTTPAVDKQRGREIAGIVPVPTAPPITLLFAYDAANPSAQPAAWVAAAKAAYAAAARPAIDLDLDILHSLRIVLAERCLAGLATQRGENPDGKQVCLTPFRQPDALRDAIFPDDDFLAALEGPSPSVPLAPAVLLRDLLDGLEENIRSITPDAGMMALQNLTAEIHRISAQFHNSAPGELPLPLDALRQTIQDRALPAFYASHSGWTSAQILTACQAADAITGNPPGIRPRLNLVLEPGESEADRTTATDVETHTTYVLLTSSGKQFRFPDGWQFYPGTRLAVVAYAGDTTADGYPTLWVIQSAFDTLVLPGRNDLDGDLLDDGWERFHFGHLAYSYGDDPLGTGYSLGEEFFARTDPNDPADLPSGPPVALAFSPVRLLIENGTLLRLSTTWPAAYAPEIEVAVFHSDDLRGFSDTGITATHTGGGAFVAEFPKPTAPRAFYQLRAKLKPAP